MRRLTCPRPSCRDTRELERTLSDAVAASIPAVRRAVKKLSPRKSRETEPHNRTGAADFWFRDRGCVQSTLLAVLSSRTGSPILRIDASIKKEKSIPPALRISLKKNLRTESVANLRNFSFAFDNPGGSFFFF